MNVYISELYTLEGRIGRMGYLWRMVKLSILAIILVFVASLSSPLIKSSVEPLIFSVIAGIFYLFFASLYLIPPLAFQVRRLHDMGYSGWFVWVPTLLCALLGVFLGAIMDPQEAYAVFTKASAIIFLLFIVFLLVCPGTDGENQYGQGRGRYFTPAKTNKKKIILDRVSNKRTYKAGLREPLAEDSLYIFKHLRSEYPDMLKVVIPESGDSVDLIVSGQSNMNDKTIRKILHNYGILTKRVKEIS